MNNTEVVRGGHGVVIHSLTKTYEGTDSPAISDLNLEVAKGEILVLLGESGSGKTTTLRCVAGLASPDRGQIRLNGRTIVDSTNGISIPVHERDVGMVFQSYALWPHLTVRQNVEFPLAQRGISSAERQRRALEALEGVRCLELADRLPSALSGGQQQRVALARALVARPAVILFDEPLSSLDTPLRADLKAQLLKLHREVQYTGIYVTHDRTEALSVGDRVAILRSGRLEQIGTPEQVFTSPSSKYVAEFLGASNSVEVAAVDSGWMVVGAGMIEGNLPAALRMDAGPKRRQLVFGPTALLLQPVGASREPAESETLCLGVGTIAESLYAGNDMHYVVEIGRMTLNVVSTSYAEKYRRGEEVRVRAVTASIHVFEV